VGANEAYQIVLGYLRDRNHVAILSCRYEDEIFGNFIVAFKAYDAERSIVCDRGQITLHDDLEGEIYSRTVMQTIYAIKAHDLTAALDDNLRDIS
jgi:hypothetical protein